MAYTIREFDHLKIPLEKILEATNNFDDRNVIGAGGFGKVYKGKLLHSGELINISARRLDRKHGQGDVEFWTEISALSVLKHDNIVSMIGFCDETDEKVIINRHDVKGSLSMYLSDPTFTWYDRLRTCVCIAKEIEYIHHVKGRGFSFIHRNINSSTVLLDDKWQPKLSGFEFSIKHSLDRKNRAIRTAEVIGTRGYIDPTYMKTGTVTHKSDVYSFGVILFDILCGNEEFRALLPEFPNEREILWDSREQYGQRRFTKVAYSCLNEDREQRPAIHEVIRELTGMEITEFRALLPEFPNEREILWESRQQYGQRRFTKVAYSCLNEDREQRPAIHEVIRELTGMEITDSLVKRVHLALVRWMYKAWGILPVLAFASCCCAIFVVVYLANLTLKLFKGVSKVVESWKGASTKWRYLAYVCQRFLCEAANVLIVSFIKMTKVLTCGFPKERSIRKDTSKEEFYSLKVKNIEHLRINLKDMHLATRDFSLANSVQFECFDRDNYIPSAEGNTEAKIRKKLYTVCMNYKDRRQDFYSELEIASSCKHRNIQPLLGFCDEGSQMILVYMYNSYEKLLFWSLRACTLTWEQRLRICIDVAQGLHYLHYEMEDQKTVIHNGISSSNIALDDNWGARIVGFEHSVFLPLKQEEVAFDSKGLYNCYIDPEYSRSKKLRRESDVYSFGVVMSEILFGSSDASLARRWFDEGIIKKKICPTLKETYSENNFILQKGPDEDSLDSFIQIMYECLAPTHSQRPTMKVVIAKLEKALSLQENYKDTFRISYEDIELATENFSRHNCVGGGGFGQVYKGKIARGNGDQAIVAKRLDTSLGQGEEQYYNELQILCRYKHENVIGLVGYCNETRERIIVYEYASRGSLDRYLSDARLTWKKRLSICIDVASGLAFLHGDAETGQEVVIHSDIKTPNILLFDDWKAKLGDFGLSLITTVYEGKNYIIDHACGTRGYVDPVYEKTRFLTIESDIYSFGVVLFEIMCGRSIYPINKNETLFLDIVKHSFEEGRQDEMVFEAIKTQIVPKSLTTFQMIAYRCLHDDREKRPTAKEVLAQLQMAMEYQEESNIQEPDVMDLSGGYQS